MIREEELATAGYYWLQHTIIVHRVLKSFFVLNKWFGWSVRLTSPTSQKVQLFSRALLRRECCSAIWNTFVGHIPPLPGALGQLQQDKVSSRPSQNR